METAVKKETGRKFDPRCPSQIVGAAERKKFDNYEFGWLYNDEINKVISEAVGKEVTTLNISYLIKSTTYTYLLTDDLRPISKSYQEKGYPIKYFDVDTNELLGFVYLDEDTIDELSYIEEGSDLDEFYAIYVTNKEEDINFQLMVKSII